MLTQEEKWHLDLLGYFVVRNAVPKADVELMKAQMFEWSEWDASDFKPPMRINAPEGNRGGSITCTTDMKRSNG